MPAKVSVELRGDQITIRGTDTTVISDLKKLAEYVILYESAEDDTTLPMVLVLWREVLKQVENLDPVSTLAYGQIQGYLTNARGAQKAARHEAMYS